MLREGRSQTRYTTPLQSHFKLRSLFCRNCLQRGATKGVFTAPLANAILAVLPTMALSSSLSCQPLPCHPRCSANHGPVILAVVPTIALPSSLSCQPSPCHPRCRANNHRPVILAVVSTIALPSSLSCQPLPCHPRCHANHRPAILAVVPTTIVLSS